MESRPWSQGLGCKSLREHLHEALNHTQCFNSLRVSINPRPCRQPLPTWLYWLKAIRGICGRGCKGRCEIDTCYPTSCSRDYDGMVAHMLFFHGYGCRDFARSHVCLCALGSGYHASHVDSDAHGQW